MSITLLCIIKGDSAINAFPIHIDKNELIGDLKKNIREEINVPENVKAKDLKLWKVEIPDDQDNQLTNISLQDGDELLATRKISKYFQERPTEEHIHIMVKLPLLSLEEALSCVPPPVTYSPKCVTSQTTTKVNGVAPRAVYLWDALFNDVNNFQFDHQQRFERPIFNNDFVVNNEETVRNATNVNICMILNRLLGRDYEYSMRSTQATGVPDFTCHYTTDTLIMVMEVKRKHILKKMGDESLPEFYQKSNKAKMVVQQIYNYMGENKLKYGILSTYDNHWFLKREHSNLWISNTLPLHSVSPPVLKAYAYLTLQSQSNHSAPYPRYTTVQVQGGGNTRTLRSHSKSLSGSNMQQSSSSGQQSNTKNLVNQKNFSFTDFNFIDILGEGRSGKTLLCEYRGEIIALKSTDLSKSLPHVLDEMQNEVNIYQELTDIQGKSIPRLLCYGYYGGGMSFVIGMENVGTMLEHHKLTKEQKNQALDGLKEIHNYGILHNDIREENVLVNSDGDVFLIDFGMAIRDDYQNNKKPFDDELREFSQLLNQYTMAVKTPSFGKLRHKHLVPFHMSRKCQVAS